MPFLGRTILRIWHFFRWKIFYWVNPPLIDFFDPDFRDDPHPSYHNIRDRASVYESGYNYFVTEHDACKHMLRQPNLRRRQGNALPPEQAELLYDLPEEILYFLGWLDRMILFTDPPLQARLRTLIHKHFTPQLMRKLRPKIQTIVDDLLDAVADKDQMDVMADLAVPLPQIIMADMLGLPRKDRQWVHERTGTLLLGLDPAQSLDPLYAASQAARELVAYIDEEIKDRRDEEGDDIVSFLFQHEKTGEISYDEIIAMVILLMIAGSETTANLIGMGVKALLEHPEEIEKLKADPSLYPNAVEELLRYVTPVQFAFRYPAENIDYRGKAVPRGGSMCMVMAAGNRDPSVFHDPDKLDVERENAKEHLSFSHGIHYCIGAQLARLEGEIAFKSLITRFPNIQLVQEETEPSPLIVVRGMKKVSISL